MLKNLAKRIISSCLRTQPNEVLVHVRPMNIYVYVIFSYFHTSQPQTKILNFVHTLVLKNLVKRKIKIKTKIATTNKSNKETNKEKNK